MGNGSILNKLTVEEMDLKGKRVFIRVDFNVPLDDNLMITDDRRIRGALPTINYCIDEGAKIILASHLGRPKGQPNPKFSLAMVAKRLQRQIAAFREGGLEPRAILVHHRRLLLYRSRSPQPVWSPEGCSRKSSPLPLY